MNLKPFFDLILSLKLKSSVSIPLLSELAAPETRTMTGPLKRRIDRRYLRLCRILDELGRLDFKEAASGSLRDFALEDFVFSRIDFSRYRKMEQKYFERLFSDGLKDFEESFLRKKFGLGRAELQSVIEGSYKKTEGLYMMQRENSLLLSVMRTLETSLETLPLFTAEEIQGELKKLSGFAEKNAVLKTACRKWINMPIDMLFSSLVLNLDNALITHEDGMTTRLFISADGDLSGTFRPGNKPWTLVLLPAGKIL